MVSIYEEEKPIRFGVDYLLTVHTEIKLDGWYHVELQKGEWIARPGARGWFIEE